MKALQARARLLEKIRAFFAGRGVLEVETPLMCSGTGWDPNLEPVIAQYRPDPQAEGRDMYLHTSPEFAMKRLVAAGSGPIYQICKVFRNGESGSRHNPEFTMLEWYRPGFDEHDLMDEVAELVEEVAGIEDIERVSYRDLFQRTVGVDPHTATAEELRALAMEKIEFWADNTWREMWVDLLFSHLVEPQLRDAAFVYDFPSDLCALARVEKDDTGCYVARRFELIAGGTEIANGYYEVTDVEDMAYRNSIEMGIRAIRGLPAHAGDLFFGDATYHGLPECSGVAVGVDRLLMTMLGARDINEVLAFPLERA